MSASGIASDNRPAPCSAHSSTRQDRRRTEHVVSLHLAAPINGDDAPRGISDPAGLAGRGAEISPPAEDRPSPPRGGPQLLRQTSNWIEIGLSLQLSLLSQQTMPVPDRPPVSFRHLQGGDLRHREKAERLVNGADLQVRFAVAAAAIGHDDHFACLQRLDGRDLGLADGDRRSRRRPARRRSWRPPGPRGHRRSPRSALAGRARPPAAPARPAPCSAPASPRRSRRRRRCARSTWLPS